MTTLQELPQVRGVKNIPIQEGYTSGHRTCQGCESALVMRLMIKAAGPRYPSATYMSPQGEGTSSAG